MVSEGTTETSSGFAKLETIRDDSVSMMRPGWVLETYLGWPWETGVALERRGYARYDLGQVPRRDAADGIDRFKRSPGTFVDFGREYHWPSPAWRVATTVRDALWPGTAR